MWQTQFCEFRDRYSSRANGQQKQDGRFKGRSATREFECRRFPCYAAFSFLCGASTWQCFQKRPGEMQDLIACASFVSGRFMLSQHDACEFPVLSVHTHCGRHRCGSLGDLPVPLDLAGERSRQIGIKRNVQVLLDRKSSVVRLPLARVERKTRLNLGSPESVCHNLVTTAQQKITECLVMTPQIQRRIAIRNGAVTPFFPQQKTFEVKLRNVIPEWPAFFRPGADQSDVVIGRQAMRVVRDDHGYSSLWCVGFKRSIACRVPGSSRCRPARRRLFARA